MKELQLGGNPCQGGEKHEEEGVAGKTVLY